MLPMLGDDPVLRRGENRGEGDFGWDRTPTRRRTCDRALAFFASYPITSLPTVRVGLLQTLAVILFTDINCFFLLHLGWIDLPSGPNRASHCAAPTPLGGVNL
jgi:hypothetical protein